MKKNVQCHLSNREKVIDDYLSGMLSDKEIDEFLQHIYECDICYEEIQFRENVALAVKKGGEATHAEIIKMPKSKPSDFNRVFIGAAAVILIVVLFGTYQLSLPKYYEIAALTPIEQKSLSVISRSDISKEESEFTKGANELLLAQQKKIGLLPYFDQDHVQNAIIHLEKAYAGAEDLFSRNKYAFFIAKAYLMMEDVQKTRFWLRRVLESDSDAYREKAMNLLQRLE